MNDNLNDYPAKEGDNGYKTLFWFENEIIKQCDISKARFHKVRGDQWESVYPKSMKEFLGCYQVDYLKRQGRGKYSDA